MVQGKEPQPSTSQQLPSEPSLLLPPQPSTLQPYPHIQKIFSKKAYTVSLEGNIAAGKSTLIEHLAKMGKVFSLREPLEKWHAMENVNQ